MTSSKNSALRGEAHANSKLTEENVKYIREAYARGRVSHEWLARRFHVNHQTIRDVIRRLSWKHVA